MNQIPMGTPAGNSDIIGRLASFMTGSGKKGQVSSRSGDIHRMAAQHALESVRSDRKHGQELERMNVGHSNEVERMNVGHANARELQSTDLAHKANQSNLDRLHEKATQVRGIRADAATIEATHGHVERTQAAEHSHAQMMETLQSGNRIAEMTHAIRGIHGIGRAGHTASFNIGSTSATFHPPVPTQTHSETPNNSTPNAGPVAAAPASPTPPEPPKNTKAYVVKHPVTGKLMANPDRIKDTPAAPETPAATKAPRTRKPKSE
jgi:hypothetical protein